MTTVILASGGLDSFLCWALFPVKYLNVFVHIGHRYASKELAALEKLGQLPGFQYRVANGANLGHLELPNGIIPLRNAHLFLGAAQYGEAILMGTLYGEINSDKSRVFLNQMEQVLTTCYRPQYWNDNKDKVFTILTPLSEYTKSEVIALYLRDDGDPAWLDMTVSCYAGTIGHCGQCASCFKRWVAYVNNNLQFTSDIDVKHYSQLPSIKYKCHDGTYDERRASEILSALTKAGYDA